jgi:hypothetical protein
LKFYTAVLRSTLPLLAAGSLAMSLPVHADAISGAIAVKVTKQMCESGMAAIPPGSVPEMGAAGCGNRALSAIVGKSSGSFSVAFMQRRAPPLSLFDATPVQFAP